MPNENISGPEDEIEKRAEFILDVLGLKWEDLAGKNVLDVGASKAELAEAAKKRGVNVLSLDMSNEFEKQAKEKGLPYIVAEAHKTGLSDHMVDLVVSHAGPMSGTGKEELLASANEAYRVTKVGGELRFGPFFNAKDGSSTLADEMFAAVQKKFPQATRGMSARSVQDSDEYVKYYFSIHRGEDLPYSETAPRN